MKSKIIEDAKSRPELYVWVGRIPENLLREWTKKQNLSVPSDLMHLWTETGGGDLFESEIILSPYASNSGMDLDAVNVFHHKRGLSSGYLVFHVGLNLSAVNLSNGKFVVLREPDYKELEVYDSLDSWYVGYLRKEFRDRYGLSD